MSWGGKAWLLVLSTKCQCVSSSRVQSSSELPPAAEGTSATAHERRVVPTLREHVQRSSNRCGLPLCAHTTPSVMPKVACRAGWWWCVLLVPLAVCPASMLCRAELRAPRAQVPVDLCHIFLQGYTTVDHRKQTRVQTRDILERVGRRTRGAAGPAVRRARPCHIVSRVSYKLNVLIVQFPHRPHGVATRPGHCAPAKP